jgi:hypothetical protein
VAVILVSLTGGRFPQRLFLADACHGLPLAAVRPLLFIAEPFVRRWGGRTAADCFRLATPRPLAADDNKCRDDPRPIMGSQEWSIF